MSAKKLIFAPLFLFFSFGLSAKTLDRIVAIVGNSPVLLSEAQDLENLFKKNPNIANFYGVGGKKITQDLIVEMLITEAVVRHSLEELNASIRESDIQKQIQSIATQNKLSVDQLRSSLKREGIAFDSYRKNIRLQLEKKAIFEREIRSSTTNVSDAELRADFNRLAKAEWKLQLWALKNSPKVSKIMQEEANNFSGRKKTLAQLSNDYGIQELGWVNADSLNPSFQKALKNSKTGDAVGPIVLKDTAHVLFVEGMRKGNEEQFQAMKEELIRRKQGADLDDLFGSWLERRKKEIRVVVNK
ncbi:hypothetical protein GW915_02015 [bacterium]|nr:hypothetical protein [bacterium]